MEKFLAAWGNFFKVFQEQTQIFGSALSDTAEAVKVQASYYCKWTHAQMEVYHSVFKKLTNKTS